MAVKVISQAQAETQHLTGRDLTWIITEETVGAKQMSIAIMHCSPHSVVRPLHAHEDIEEVILILEGEGEALVDGETAKFKKGMRFFPPTQASGRNTEMAVGYCVNFSAPTNPDSYLIYDEDVFAD